MSLLEPLNEGVTAGLRRSSETDLFPSKAPLLIMSLNGRPSGALAATAAAETSAGGFGPESLCGSARFALACIVIISPGYFICMVYHLHCYS